MAKGKASFPTDTSFSKSLFFGNILEEMVFPYPEIPKEEKENLQLFLDSFKQYAQKNIDSSQLDKEEKISKEILQGLAELGIFGAGIPCDYGGAGLSATCYARLMEEVCHHDASLGVTMGAHYSIGLKGLLLFGTEAQKKKYLPDLATGKMLAAFALTEPGAGSDAAGIQTKAVFSEDKKKYIFNCNKIKFKKHTS